MTMIEENHTPEILAMDAREVRLIVNSMIEAGNGDRFQLTPNSFARLYEYIDHLTAQLAAKDAEVKRLSIACEKVIEIEAELWAESPQGYPSGVYPEEQALSKLRLAMKCCRAALAATSRGEGGINATG